MLQGVDGESCVLSVHDADSLVKLMATDAIQEVASDRRLCRVVALVSQPVFEALRDIHVRQLPGRYGAGLWALCFASRAASFW